MSAACLCLALVSSVTGCVTPKEDPALGDLLEHQADTPPSGELGPGDKIAVGVLYEEALSGQFTVSPEGTISYPYVGRLNVNGKTCLQIEDDITAALQDGYLAEPSVTCSILEYNSRRIFVFGEVMKPGAYPYRSDSTIIEAIALAGGFSQRAEVNRARLNRQVEDKRYQIEVPVQDMIEGRRESLKVMPGDVIYVPHLSLVTSRGRITPD